MSKSYCNKSCDDCKEKELLKCPGCQIISSKSLSNNCSVAKCCTNKGLCQCESCEISKECRMLQNRDETLKHELKKLELAEKEKESRIEKAQFLAPKMKFLFYLIIPYIVVQFMMLEFVKGIAPSIYSWGKIIAVATNILYGVILLSMGKAEDRYKTAGICIIICGISGVLDILNIGGSLLSSILITIVSLYGGYSEYMAHADILADINPELSQNWKNLWKWYIGSMIGLFASIIVVFISPVLAFLILMGAGIITIGVYIAKFVYIYKSTKSLENYK